MRPCVHRYACTVGTPVEGFGVELVYDCPANCPRALNGVPTEVPAPPSVPMSRITPSRQTNVRVCVFHGNIENSSGVPFEENPATMPRSSMVVAKLSYPPGRVP